MLTLIVSIVGLILYFNLRNRISDIEESVKGLGKTASQSNVSQAHTNVVQSNPFTELVSAPIKVTASPVQNGPSAFDRFTDWLKDDWPLKFGVLLLIIGFGWFTTYAFVNNWIGPMGRIALGIVAGAIFLILGSWRIKNFLHQGGAFLVLGSTTILLTIFAAREIYDFFTPMVALTVMFLSTAFVAFVSTKYNNRELALASLILAGIAPLLTNAPATDYIGLFTYLLVVILGAIWITAITGRRELTTAALILVAFYSLPHLIGFARADRGTLLLFAYMLASLFFLTNISSLIKSKDQNITADVITAIGNGIFLLSWISVGAPDEWKSLIISAWMVVFVAGAYLIHRFNNKKEAFYTYAGLGIAMIAAATSAELDGASLTIAYAIESGAVSLIIYKILKDLRVASQTSLLLLGPAFLSLSSLTSQAWTTGVVHKDFFVLLIMSVILFIIGLFFWDRSRQAPDPEVLGVGPAFIIGGSLYAYALIWLSSHAVLFNDDTAVIISLFVFTVVAIVAYFWGKVAENNTVRMYGATVLGCVIVRLFLVDVWKMALAGKIVTFFLLGTLLVSTAFIGRKKPSLENINNIQS